MVVRTVNNFAVSQNYKFLHNGHPSYFGSLLSTHCGRYSTRYSHPNKFSWRVPQFYPSVYVNPKNTLATALLLMPQQFAMICLMRFVQHHFLPVSEKAFPT